jgi:putative transposase
MAKEEVEFLGVQQILLNPKGLDLAILEYLCQESNNLYNCTMFIARQKFFEFKKLLTKVDCQNQMKNNKHFEAMPNRAAQSVTHQVGEAIKSYKELAAKAKKGNLNQSPRFPSYRKSGGMNKISFCADFKLEGDLIRLPLGFLCKAWFGLKSFYIPMPSNLDFNAIRQVRVVPRNGCFYAEYVYGLSSVNSDLDPVKVLGIDHGLNNWLTCVSNVGTSFIVDGLKLKSLNQGYNKRVAKLMSGKQNGFWSKRLKSLTEKRNRQMRDAVNKAARIVISHCVENKIGTLVFGWNKSQKQGATMGNKTNQKFVQIPTARLKERIKQLCEIHGIQFVETEESYTSKASFLDSDTLPVYGEKPKEWKSKGKRVKRGLFRSANNVYINADCNGAANIIRKVATTLGLCLDGVSRGSLTSPLKIRLWSLTSSQKSQSL